MVQPFKEVADDTTEFVYHEMPVIRHAGLTQLQFKHAVICE